MSAQNRLRTPVDAAEFLAGAHEKPVPVVIGSLKESPGEPAAATPEPAPPPTKPPKKPAKTAAQPPKAAAAVHAPAPTPPKAPAARKPAKQATKRIPPPAPAPDYPWMHANERVRQTFNLRFDEATYLKLKWLGDTQYGETMHSIAMQAVAADIEARLKALGIDPDAAAAK